MASNNLISFLVTKPRGIKLYHPNKKHSPQDIQFLTCIHNVRFNKKVEESLDTMVYLLQCAQPAQYVRIFVHTNAILVLSEIIARFMNEIIVFKCINLIYYMSKLSSSIKSWIYEQQTIDLLLSKLSYMNPEMIDKVALILFGLITDSNASSVDSSRDNLLMKLSFQMHQKPVFVLCCKLMRHCNNSLVFSYSLSLDEQVVCWMKSICCACLDFVIQEKELVSHLVAIMCKYENLIADVFLMSLRILTRDWQAETELSTSESIKINLVGLQLTRTVLMNVSKIFVTTSSDIDCFSRHQSLLCALTTMQCKIATSLAIDSAYQNHDFISSVPMIMLRNISDVMVQLRLTGQDLVFCMNEDNTGSLKFDKFDNGINRTLSTIGDVDNPASISILKQFANNLYWKDLSQPCTDPSDMISRARLEVKQACKYSISQQAYFLEGVDKLNKAMEQISSDLNNLKLVGPDQASSHDDGVFLTDVKLETEGSVDSASFWLDINHDSQRGKNCNWKATCKPPQPRPPSTANRRHGSISSSRSGNKRPKKQNWNARQSTALPLSKRSLIGWKQRWTAKNIIQLKISRISRMVQLAINKTKKDAGIILSAGKYTACKQVTKKTPTPPSTQQDANLKYATLLTYPTSRIVTSIKKQTKFFHRGRFVSDK